MSNCKVTLEISAESAIKAGRARSGRIDVELTDDFIQSLTAEQRDELAGMVRQPYVILPSRGEASLETVRAVIQERIEAANAKKLENAAKAELIREQCMDVLTDRRTYTISERINGYNSHYSYLSPAWPLVSRFEPDVVREAAASVRELPEAKDWEVELELNRKELYDTAVRLLEQELESKKKAEDDLARENTENEKRFSCAAGALVRQFGDEDMIERLDAGLLPEAELESFVRDHIFAGVKDFPGYEKLRNDDIGHSDDCEYLQDGEASVEYEKEEAKELSASQWKLLKAIRASAPSESTVTPQVHTGCCQHCDVSTQRFSACVKIQWHGRAFSRLLALS